MGFTKKQRLFIEYYLQHWNASKAALLAGYSERTAYSIGWENLKKPEIAAEIRRRIDEVAMTADEVLVSLSGIARATISDFMDVDEYGKLMFNFQRAKEEGKLGLIKKVVPTVAGLKVELHDPVQALQLLGKHHNLFNENGSDSPTQNEDESILQLPASAIASSFYDAYRDIHAHGHTEYVFKGGRGSTKSSFVSLVLIELLVNNPEWHALATRQVANTLRDSVYAQLVWAINYLGYAEKFKCTTSPLEITYVPTGQKIYFRGGDDPLKIKSIKPRFGYINILWFEELDQFRGEAAVRSIEQSALRGGDLAYIFKSFNPPASKNCWVNKWLEVPNPARFVHHSDYRSVPEEWLGRAFIDMAEHLSKVNLKAYQHEYLGLATELGGLVFPNVVIRKITDEEIYGEDDGQGHKIGGFDHILHGLDWGYFPDPNSYGKMHYDAARMKLYIFGEYRSQKQSNREIYNGIVAAGYDPRQLLIYDSAEPKSGADLRAYGAYAKGAEKGPESVRYSIKWLQSLVEIVIDDTRAPFHAQEFLNYELEQDRDGNYISEFPDKNNHAIDDVRYATNLYWRRAGA